MIGYGRCGLFKLNKARVVCLACCSAFTMAIPVRAAEDVVAEAKAKKWRAIDLRPFRDCIHHARMKFKNEIPPYAVWKPKRIVHIAENLLAHQYQDGGWPKNVDWQRAWSDQELDVIRKTYGSGPGGTLDNRNIRPQVRYLALVYQQTGIQRYAEAAGRGLKWILDHQNKRSGGWRGADVDAITFNDDVMVGVLRTLRQVAEDDRLYGFVSREDRAAARRAYDRGIACILKCQIKVGDRLTAWCQQHNHEDFSPVGGRGFEPPSITAGESVRVMGLLMEIERPPPEVVQAIQSAVAWFEKVKIEGLHIKEVPADPVTFKHHYSDCDRVQVADPGAPPIWTRFYDLATEEPIFCTVEGRLTTRYTDLSRERRTGYSFYGRWPVDLLARDYPHWQRKWAPGNNVLTPGPER